MRVRIVLPFLLLLVQRVCAQPVLTEPPDFSNSLPGPVAAHTGVECFHMASGSITPGDVDWVQLTIGFSSARTVVDVDFTGQSSRSFMLTGVVGGSTRFSMSDGNKPDDDLCGLGSLTTPLGSTNDSAADLGQTIPGTVINIAITGASDSGFTGNHSQSFDYDLWVYVLRQDFECLEDEDCNDSVDCTVDRCLPTDHTCQNLANDGLCDDGLFCNGQETCDARIGCRATRAPCAEDLGCDEANDRCVGCFADADCADESFCNGEEKCVRGACVLGEVPGCDDGIDCTADFCDSEKDRCRHVPRHRVCNDGRLCNGRETCHPERGCQPGPRRCRPPRVRFIP